MLLMDSFWTLFLVFSFSAQLEAQVVELQEKLQRCESDLEEKTAQHKTDVGGLRKSLRAKETDKEQIIRDKDTLLDEVWLGTQ